VHSAAGHYQDESNNDGAEHVYDLPEQQQLIFGESDKITGGVLGVGSSSAALDFDPQQPGFDVVCAFVSDMVFPYFEFRYFFYIIPIRGILKSYA